MNHVRIYCPLTRSVLRKCAQLRIFFSLGITWSGFSFSGSACVSLPPPATKSRPAGSASDTPEKEKEEKTAASSTAATKSQDSAPSTPTKNDKDKKDKPSKKKDKSSKGAVNLPPVESKPPPGPLVALGRRDKPLKRPRSVFETGTTRTHVSYCLPPLPPPPRVRLPVYSAVYKPPSHTRFRTLISLSLSLCVCVSVLLCSSRFSQSVIHSHQLIQCCSTYVGVYCSTHSNKRPGNLSRYDKSHKQCAVGFVPIKGVCITSRYGYIGGDVALLPVYVVFYMSTETHVCPRCMTLQTQTCIYMQPGVVCSALLTLARAMKQCAFMTKLHDSVWFNAKRPL